MRETMASFLSNQLDFIFFFYGLAFVLLGATCFGLSKSNGQSDSWAALGWFGFVHGGSEWLDLTALILGDAPAFAIARTALMTASFVFLLEFARLEAIRLGLKLPGSWIHVPLLLVVFFFGVAGGTTTAGIVARYTIGFGGAMGTGLVFAWQAAVLHDGTRRRFSIATALGFALYAIATGMIVPAAAFWPAIEFNYAWFASLTGTPIQLVRGILACCISFSIWAIRGSHLSLEVASQRYTAYLRQQFIWTLVSMTAILACGWTLTEYLGTVYRENVQQEAQGDIDLLASRFTGETAMVEGMVKALAGSPSMVPLLTGGSRHDNESAQALLDLNVEASGAHRGYILDRNGEVVASSTRQDFGRPVRNYSAASYFQQSIAGAPGYHFAFDPVTGGRDYYASQPIRDANGRIVGVAVLAKSLAPFETDLRQLDRPYFFIDPDGIIVMTNRPGMLLRTFWPLDAAKQAALAPRFGGLKNRPLIAHEMADATWTLVDGERDFIRRRFVAHSQWSLVILKPSREIFASRLLGIVITFLVTMMVLIYLLGRERWVHDSVQMDNRLKLQELARALGFKATTDPLTRLPNRLKFDEALAREIARAERYETPLSLVIYDVDHFKQVNDTYGHPVGDKVLIQLSECASNILRSTDLLARWGGEEFVILLPGADGPSALQVAEKLRQLIERKVFEGAGTVTCSFGVVERLPGESEAALIARADEALYRAKINGRNQVQLGTPDIDAASALMSVA